MPILFKRKGAVADAPLSLHYSPKGNLEVVAVPASLLPSLTLAVFTTNNGC